MTGFLCDWDPPIILFWLGYSHNPRETLFSMYSYRLGFGYIQGYAFGECSLSLFRAWAGEVCTIESSNWIFFDRLNGEGHYVVVKDKNVSTEVRGTKSHSVFQVCDFNRSTQSLQICSVVMITATQLQRPQCLDPSSALNNSYSPLSSAAINKNNKSHLWTLNQQCMRLVWCISFKALSLISVICHYPELDS